MVGNYTADLGPRPLCARLLPVSFKSVDPFLGPFFFLCAFCFSFPTFLFEARTLSVFPRCKGAGRHHIIIIIISRLGGTLGSDARAADIFVGTCDHF